MEISLPTDFEHTIHVGFNRETGEFTVSLQQFCLYLEYTMEGKGMQTEEDGGH